MRKTFTVDFQETQDKCHNGSWCNSYQDFNYSSIGSTFVDHNTSLFQLTCPGCEYNENLNEDEPLCCNCEHYLHLSELLDVWCYNDHITEEDIKNLEPKEKEVNND